jgi:hypothetical protein
MSIKTNTLFFSRAPIDIKGTDNFSPLAVGPEKAGGHGICIDWPWNSNFSFMLQVFRSA